MKIIIIIRINTYLILLHNLLTSFFFLLYIKNINKVKSEAHCRRIYSPEFHEIHYVFFSNLRTKGYSTIHGIKLPPHPLALRDRFNPIDFKSCAQRNNVNCEGQRKERSRTLRSNGVSQVI